MCCGFTIQVLPSQDPLDSPDFNPVDYINQLFPTEQVGGINYYCM